MAADFIKELRGRLGISQEKLAQRIGVSVPTVNRWEKGKVKPDSMALRLIREFVAGLGPDYADLLERRLGSPDSHPGSAGPTPLDTKTMEGMLWKAACSIRGEKDAAKFKDYILPLMFIKRLSDVFEDEIARLTRTHGDEATAHAIVDADHSVVRFYLPPEATWPVLSGRRKHDWPEGKSPKTLGEHLTSAMRAIAKANPDLQGVIDMVDFNAQPHGEREISDDTLRRLIEIFSDARYRLGLHDVEPDFLGRAYEYLLGKFAEDSGQSAGEFFTPREVGWLIARMVDPRPGQEVYDPCCGSGGLLIKCQLLLKEREKKVGRPLRLHGQEWTGSSFAIARMNMVIHDMAGEIVRGDTMTNPKFLEEGRLKRFDLVVTNPMWNQKNFSPAFYETDPYERFTAGYAPANNADWAWLQHVAASLKESGRAAVVLDTAAATRGSGSQGDDKENAIRKAFLERDWIEAVILLPDNLFYNTNAAGIIVVLNKAKPKDRKGKIILINAAGEFQKGRPKNFLPEESIRKIAEAFHAGKDVERFAKIVPVAEIAGEKHDGNLSPSRYIETAAPVEHRDVQAILNDLANLDVESKHLDGDLKGIFEGLGYKWGSHA